MDPLKIIQKLTIEITDQKVFDAYFIRDRIAWAFVAGWEEGVQYCSGRRPVVQMDQYGRVIKIYKSEKDAGKIDGFDQTAINAVCKGRRHSCSGFLWKYVDNPIEIKKILNEWQNKL